MGQTGTVAYSRALCFRNRKPSRFPLLLSGRPRPCTLEIAVDSPCGSRTNALYSYPHWGDSDDFECASRANPKRRDPAGPAFREGRAGRFTERRDPERETCGSEARAKEALRPPPLSRVSWSMKGGAIVNEDSFREQLLERLNIIVRLLVETSQADKPANRTQAAGRLSEMGLDTGSIAGILGMRSKDVSTALRRYNASKGKERND